MVILNAAIIWEAPLAIQVALLYWLSGRIVFLQLRIHRMWFYFNAIVGTAIHETSHAVGCIITGIRITEFRPFSPRSDGTLGWVTHTNRGPVISAIISIAPLFGNGEALYLLGKILFAGIAEPVLQIPEASSESTGAVLANLWQYVVDYGNHRIAAIKQIDLGDWRSYLFFYLAMSIGSHATPSMVDIKHFVAAMISIMVVLFVGGWVLVGYGPGGWTATIGEVIGKVALGMTAVVALSVAFCVLAVLLNFLLFLVVHSVRIVRTWARCR